MKSIANVLFILFVSTAPLLAHVVVWFENPSGFTPNSPMEVDYPGDGELILVQPVIGEPCTVEVNMDTPASSLVKVEVISANPAVEVQIRVTALRAPIGDFEKVTITGEWHATGFPPNQDCTAVTPNLFSVPVRVYAAEPEIISISKPSGHPGEEITISGTGFDRVSSVVFGNVSAAFTIVNSGSIKVTVPTNAPVGSIFLVTPTGGAKSQQRFVVQPIIHLDFGTDNRAHLYWGEMNYPFTVQCTPSLSDSRWADILTTVNHELDLPLSPRPVFYRLAWSPIPTNPVDYNRDRPAVASFYWQDPVNYWSAYGVPALARLANMQKDLGSTNMDAFNGFLNAFDSAKFTNALQTHQLPEQFEFFARSYLTNSPNLTNAYVNSFVSLVAENDKLTNCPDLFRTNCLATNQLTFVFAKVLTNTAHVNTLTNWAPQTNKVFFNPSQQTNTPSINWVDTHGSDAFAVTQITTAHPGDNDSSFTVKWADITSPSIWNTSLNGACASVAVGASLAKLGVGPAETTCRFWNELAGLMGTTTNIVGAYDDGIAGLYKTLGYGCNGAYDGPFESAAEEAKKALARGCDVQIDYTSADGTRGHTELVHSITLDPTDSSKATISTLSWGQNATVRYSGSVAGGTYSGKSDGNRYRKATETTSWLEVNGSATLRYYCKE